MANTFFGLTIGKTGLYTYQAAVNTAAHNASNIDTEGYTRQETNRTAANPLSLSTNYGMIGSGVNVTSITSVRDAYYDSKYRYNNAILANQNTKAYYLDTVQSYFSEVNSDGVSASLDEFFTSISALTGDVGNTTKRMEMASLGTTFTQSVNYLYDSLQRTQKEINQEIKTIANQINAYAEELVTLTRQINTVEVRGENANDLRDKRELLVDKLSEYANVTATEISADNTTNQYIVKLDGAILVDTYEYYTLDVQAAENKVNEDDIDGLYDLVWSNGQKLAASSKTLGGKLQSLFELRDGNNNKNFNGTIAPVKTGDTTITVKGANIQSVSELNIPLEDGVITVGNTEYVYESYTMTYDDNAKEYVYTFKLKEAAKADNAETDLRIGRETAYKGIPYYMAQINEFTRTFAMDFNELHKQGKDAYGNCEELNFFTGTEAGTGKELSLDGSSKNAMASYCYLNAGNFKVTAEITDDARKIACGESKEGTNSGIEDNGILRKLGALQTDTNMFKQGTPSAFFESFIAVLGVSGKEAESFVERQEAIMAAVEKQKMSVSGVDQDEEAMDIVKFKNAYDLCSKIISTMNEIYEKLINETGV